MLSANFTLNDAAAAAKTFNLVFQQGQESRRLDTSSTDASPRTMRVVHQETGPAGARANRHNVAFAKSYVDSNGVTQTSLASLTLQVSKDATASAFIDDLVAFVKNFLATGANVDAIRRGES